MKTIAHATGVGLSIVRGYTSTLIAVELQFHACFFNPPFGTGGTIENLHMNYRKEQNKEFRKNLIIILATDLITVFLFSWIKKTLGLAGGFEDQMAYTESILDSTKLADSVDLVQGKVSRKDLETDYSTDNWLNEYNSNKIAFDNKYRDKVIDVYGKVQEISELWGCSQVILKTENGLRLTITCSNCPHSKDKWVNEVEKTSVGSTIHVRGIYGASTSDRYTMQLTECHIIDLPY